MIKIVTDSTCDLPSGWFERYKITVVPVNIQFGLDTVQEGVNITPAAFYQRIDQAGELPTTSQPPVGAFIQLYQQLAADGSQILSIHLTSKLSGTWQAATLAARQLQNSINVTVFDSLTSSIGLGFMVREAAYLSQAGLGLEEIVQRLEARREQINIYIMLKDLRYARMSGRVGRIRETFAALLDVKPIIGTEEGALVPLERVRGQKKGLKRMVELAYETLGQTPVHVGVAHAIDRPQAETLLAQIQRRLTCQETFITDLAISLAVHFGPGTVGFATYPADYQPGI